ncbi:MAG: MgtC/SapB family protein [Anaerolineaceae bacterium]|nr:MgtC/SapB family protein [Anaerolineaceae bacterium]
MDAIPFSEMLMRLGLSVVLGGIIGAEREHNNQPAGLRTNMILVIGACLAMMLSINLGTVAGADPARLAAQVVSGIGFLGAGAILRFGFNVKGLTTATTLWTMAIVGLAVGMGYYLISMITTAVIMIVLSVLDLIERRFVRANILRTIMVEVYDVKGIAKEIRNIVDQFSFQTTSFSVQKSNENKLLQIEIVARFNNSEKLEDLIERLSEFEGLKSFNIE